MSDTPASAQSAGFTAIRPGELLERVMYLKHAGYRLVQISCTKTGGYELNYSFDLNMDLVHLKLTFSEPVPLPSITDLYPGAFLYENEISELFNLRIRGINIDYNGTLYKTDIKHPFAPDMQAPDAPQCGTSGAPEKQS